MTTVPCTQCGGAGRQTCSACGGAGSRTVSINEQRPCPQCGGSNVNCPVCSGCGYVIDCVTQQEACGMCGGNGQSPCSACSGTGTVTVAVYEPDPPGTSMGSLNIEVPTDTLPHLSAATSEQMRPDPLEMALVYAHQQQLEYQGYLDAPIRQQEYEDYVAESQELEMESLDWREWDVRRRLIEGGHGPHPIEEAGEGLVK